MNKVVILGRLTKDPEVRYTPSQKVVASFTLAVDRPFLNQEGIDVEGIKQTLIDEGIVCLKSTDL